MDTPRHGCAMSIVRYFPTLKKVYQHTMEGKRVEINGTINNQTEKLFSTGHGKP